MTEKEIDALCAAVLAAVDKSPRSPDEIRAATGSASRSLGEAGKKKGMSSTLPLALGRLQRAGDIRRVPVNGRLDQQRYGYVRWRPNPRGRTPIDSTQAYTALAERFFRWVGPATVAEWQWYSGLGVKASAAILAPLALVPMEPRQRSPPPPRRRSGVSQVQGTEGGTVRAGEQPRPAGRHAAQPRVAPRAG